MTTKAEEKLSEKETAKAAREARKTELEARELKANEGRTGKGTRIAVSLSRGRNPQPVEYEAFDDSKTETLPVTQAEFMEMYQIVMGQEITEPVIVGYLIDGFNSAQYTAASDPVAEYVEASWPEEIQKNFRAVVRNYAQGANVSIEDAAALIKPGIVASEAKKAEAKAAAANVKA